MLHRLSAIDKSSRKLRNFPLEFVLSDDWIQLIENENDDDKNDTHFTAIAAKCCAPLTDSAVISIQRQYTPFHSIEIMSIIINMNEITVSTSQHRHHSIQSLKVL